MPHKLTLTDKILEKTLLKLIPQWMTPNIISWMRFASIPFIGYVFWVEQYAVALILFFISTFSDAVDGSLARTRNMVTDFGKLLAPVADKLLIAVTALIIVPRYLDWSIVLTIIAIDLILITSAYVRKRYYGAIIQAENTGKIKMILQSLGVGTLLLHTLIGIPALLTLAQYLFYGAIFFALVSLVVYRAV